MFRSPRAAARVLVACVLAGATASLSAQLGYTAQVTPGLVAAYARQFERGARERINAWVDFARVQKVAPRIARLLDTPCAELDALQTVNAFFNRIPFLPDATHWRVEDYWATPAELTASNGGDCEDYAIAKYFLLKELGVPVERMRITCVKATRINEAHMVLAYYASPGAQPLIPDNIENNVRPPSVRISSRSTASTTRTWSSCATRARRSPCRSAPGAT